MLDMSEHPKIQVTISVDRAQAHGESMSVRATNVAASRHPATSEFFATILGAERESPDFLEEALFLPLFGKTRVMSGL